MTVIKLNETIRNAARTSPTYLLTIIGMYAATGKVNNLDLNEVDAAVKRANQMASNTHAIPVREDFESDEAYNDQVNQLAVILELATTLNYEFEAETVPEMIDELYARIEANHIASEAYHAISPSVRRMEEAFMDKAKKELF
ncbi:hypothetical protein pEaSNUABM6_00152 [Erwinia phage pEa_SNUABM_6]|nr:hypothetical protein pEaSNUABM6_00152 [Erwinia phage pEa_SNUABM_6]